MVFWAVGLQGIFNMFRDQNPWYARLGLLYAVYGCLGGIAFGFEGLFGEILGIDKVGIEAYGKFSLQMNLVLYWAGPAFPLSVMVLGGFMIYRKNAGTITGVLLILGAVAFPLSRIVRTEWIAHIADSLLLAGVTLLAVRSGGRTSQ